MWQNGKLHSRDRGLLQSLAAMGQGLKALIYMQYLKYLLSCLNKIPYKDISQTKWAVDLMTFRARS